jgi:hypothetical protein
MKKAGRSLEILILSDIRFPPTVSLFRIRLARQHSQLQATKEVSNICPKAYLVSPITISFCCDWEEEVNLEMTNEWMARCEPRRLSQILPETVGAPGFLLSHFMPFRLPLLLGLAVPRHCALSLELQVSVHQSPGNFDSKNAA